MRSFVLLAVFGAGLVLRNDDNDGDGLGDELPPIPALDSYKVRPQGQGVVPEGLNAKATDFSSKFAAYYNKVVDTGESPDPLAVPADKSKSMVPLLEATTPEKVDARKRIDAVVSQMLAVEQPRVAASMRLAAAKAAATAGKAAASKAASNSISQGYLVTKKLLSDAAYRSCAKLSRLPHFPPLCAKQAVAMFAGLRKGTLTRWSNAVVARATKAASLRAAHEAVRAVAGLEAQRCPRAAREAAGQAFEAEWKKHEAIYKAQAQNDVAAIVAKRKAFWQNAQAQILKKVEAAAKAAAWSSPAVEADQKATRAAIAAANRVADAVATQHLGPRFVRAAEIVLPRAIRESDTITMSNWNPDWEVNPNAPYIPPTVMNASHLPDVKAGLSRAASAFPPRNQESYPFHPETGAIYTPEVEPPQQQSALLSTAAAAQTVEGSDNDTGAATADPPATLDDDDREDPAAPAVSDDDPGPGSDSADGPDLAMDAADPGPSEEFADAEAADTAGHADEAGGTDASEDVEDAPLESEQDSDDPGAGTEGMAAPTSGQLEAVLDSAVQQEMSSEDSAQQPSHAVKGLDPSGLDNLYGKAFQWESLQYKPLHTTWKNTIYTPFRLNHPLMRNRELIADETVNMLEPDLEIINPFRRPAGQTERKRVANIFPRYRYKENWGQDYSDKPEVGEMSKSFLKKVTSGFVREDQVDDKNPPLSNKDYFDNRDIDTKAITYRQFRNAMGPGGWGNTGWPDKELDWRGRVFPLPKFTTPGRGRPDSFRDHPPRTVYDTYKTGFSRGSSGGPNSRFRYQRMSHGNREFQDAYNRGPRSTHKRGQADKMKWNAKDNQFDEVLTKADYDLGPLWKEPALPKRSKEWDRLRR
mmetsp:Transcript_21339/g.54499  ORF Transcript_21339/g.54499 Transcript_21339/m.54499 type:complete len:869 (-) Transcript_21339:69-2675(-)